MLQTGNTYAAALIDLTATLKTTTSDQVVHPLLVLQTMAIVAFRHGVAGIILAVIQGVLGALLGVSPREASRTYQTITSNTRSLAHERKDFVLLSGVLAKQLTDTFSKIDNYRSMSPSSKTILKHRWLRRHRDILFAQLLLPTDQTNLVDGEVDLLAEARSKLDEPSSDRNIPDLIKRLQSIRAEHLAAFNIRDPRHVATPSSS